MEDFLAKSSPSKIMEVLAEISKRIRCDTTFKEGVVFRDISPLLANGPLWNKTLDMMADLFSGSYFDYIALVDARGFLFASLAEKMGCGIVMVRKGGKMPNMTTIDYKYEYSSGTIGIAKDSAKKGSRILIVDDLAATMGTARAAYDLFTNLGCTVIGILTLVKLTGFESVFIPDHRYLLEYPKDSVTTETSLRTKNYHLRVKEYQEGEQRGTLIFCHPSMRPLAEDMVTKYAKIANVDWGKFPDGTPNITFESDLSHKCIIFILSCEHFIEEMSLLRILPRQMIHSLDIIIPFFPWGTMERVEYEGQVATADTMAGIISSSLIMTKSGPPIIHLYDLHALANRFYFNDNVIVKMESIIPKLKKIIGKNWTVAFPDDGACKRFKSFFKDYKIIVCSKVREGDARRIRIVDWINCKEDDPIDDVVIIDDLVMSGGTLEECRKALKGYGAKRIHCYVTHGVFPNQSWRKFVNKSPEDSFETFWVSDTIPRVRKLSDYSPFVVINAFGSVPSPVLTKQFHTLWHNEPAIIYVASHNDIKLKAAYNQFGEAYVSRIFGVDVPSGVPEQPVGVEETERGCKNRWEYLEQYIFDHGYQYDYFVAIENGIANDDKGWYDFCCVKARKRNSNVETSFSTKCYFEEKYALMSLKSGQTRTVGSFIEEDLGIESGTWHEKISGFGRIWYIEKAIKNLILKTV